MAVPENSSSSNMFRKFSDNLSIAVLSAPFSPSFSLGDTQLSHCCAHWKELRNFLVVLLSTVVIIIFRPFRRALWLSYRQSVSAFVGQTAWSPDLGTMSHPRQKRVELQAVRISSGLCQSPAGSTLLQGWPYFDGRLPQMYCFYILVGSSEMTLKVEH